MRIAGVLLLTLFEIASLNAQPWTPQVIWDRSGEQDSSAYGYEILQFGDQNADGYADWAVWAYGGGNDPSYLEFFHGGNPPSTTPYMTVRDDPNGLWWIWNVGVAGDVNGDSLSEWFLTQRFASLPARKTLTLYSGSSYADTVSVLTLSLQLTDWVAQVGDLNGDGRSDLAVRHYTGRWTDIYFGGTPMDTIPDWSKHSTAGSPSDGLPFGFGNLNGDRYSDFVSATSTPVTYVFFGSAQPDTVPLFSWSNFQDWPRGVVKDLNGSGFDDLIFGIYEGVQIVFGGINMDSLPDVTLDFPCSQGGPWQAISAGDINSDGYQDLIVIAENCLDSQAGTLAMYLGHPWLNPNPAFVLRSGTGTPNLTGIWTAAGLGDVNGDSTDDFAVGAYTEDLVSGTRGRVVIMAGDTTLTADTPEPRRAIPQQFMLSVYPNPFNAVATISFVMPRAGEVKVELFDLTGRRVKTLWDGRREAGELAVVFEGKGLASGVYFVRAKVGAESRAVKVMLLK